MKHRIIYAACALAACATLLAGGVEADGAARKMWEGAARIQEQPQKKVSEAENKAFEKIKSAPTPDEKLKAAADFMKSYPKTQIAENVVEVVAESIAGVQDPAQRIPLFERLLSTVNDPVAANRVYPSLVDSYVNANRLDDAYRVADAWLGKNPDEVTGRTRLALIAINEAQKQNPKFIAAGQKYAREAIALMEANKRPAYMDDAAWQQFKGQWQPQLYQALGLVAHSTGNTAEAQTYLDKAAALGITDPITFALMADIADREYEALATKYKGMSAGAEQDAALKKALEQLDKVIEMYAHAVALTEGKPEYQPVRQQLMQTLETYYKYRKGSSEGLQQLIDKYKKAPAAQ